MYDYGARFYDPQLGRFTTQDQEAESVEALSPYHYCSNDPISHTYPTGKSTEGAPLGYTSTFIYLTGNIIYVDPNDGDCNIYLVDNVDEWQRGGRKKWTRRCRIYGNTRFIIAFRRS